MSRQTFIHERDRYHKLTPSTTDRKTKRIAIWADGGCKRNGRGGTGGWGVVMIGFNAAGEITRVKEYKGSKHYTTNNEMELTAVIFALNKVPAKYKISVTCDSQYVLKGITEWRHNWILRNWRTYDGSPVANKELWQQLIEACDGKDITWKWVKGHSGHPQNERADELANLAIEWG